MKRYAAIESRNNDKFSDVLSRKKTSLGISKIRKLPKRRDYVIVDATKST